MPDTTATVILPDGIYGDGDIRLMLGITSATTTRARREGRLRYSRQGNRILYRGQWVLDWLEADADTRQGAAS